MNKRNIIIYISGAYMGKDEGKSIDENIRIARKMAITLWELGYTVICPHLNTQNFERDCKCNYDDYIEGDISLVKKSDGIMMLDNWKESNGASIERQAAFEDGIPVFYSIEQLEEWF